MSWLDLQGPRSLSTGHSDTAGSAQVSAGGPRHRQLTKGTILEDGTVARVFPASGHPSTLGDPAHLQAPRRHCRFGSRCLDKASNTFFSSSACKNVYTTL